MPATGKSAARVGAHWRGAVWWWVLLAAGLALRLWFLCHPMPHDDDTDVYAELGQNLFHHHIYGLMDDGTIDPTLIRLPGYPIFLGVMFAVFGVENFTAVLLAQIAFDLLACWLIASFVREEISERAGMAAFALALLCPFTASYAATALTESLSVFAVALALWATGRLLRGMSAGGTDRTAIVYVAAAGALAMLLRPDGALVIVSEVVAIVWYAVRQRRLRAWLRSAVAAVLLAVLPLAPWALRNWRTFHVIQPLAPRRVNDPGEYVTYGFYRWMNTWSVDVVSTGNVFWQVGTAPIDVRDLPSRAFDSAAQREETAQLLADYHAAGNTVTRPLDARFDALAEERIRAHPILCRVWVPILRVTDMLLRPRTETMGLDAEWWRLPPPWLQQMEIVVLGLLNIALVIAGIVGLLRCRVPWAALPVIYIVLRCALLSTMENSEPRYTLELLPVWIACAACAFAGSRQSTPITKRASSVSRLQGAAVAAHP